MLEHCDLVPRLAHKELSHWQAPVLIGLQHPLEAWVFFVDLYRGLPQIT
jgi:hypothetical protein